MTPGTAVVLALVLIAAALALRAVRRGRTGDCMRCEKGRR